MYNKSDSESVSDDSEPEEDIGHVKSNKSTYKSTRSRGKKFGAASSDPLNLGSASKGSKRNLTGAGESLKRKKKVRQADPNVFTISVGDYVTPDNLHPNNRKLSCGNCKAIMTSFSRFEAKAGVNDWKCEFCLNVNHDVDLSDWTKPTSDDVTFLVEEPPTEDERQRGDNHHYVIFVIDISGSMGTTSEVDNVDASGRRTRRFISRLDAVKTAAKHQIQQLKEETPNVRVGLISFGSHVYVYGDGTTPVREYNEKEMADYQLLKTLASDAPPLKPISETYDILIQRLLGLSTLGMTALGPSLLTAIGLATNAAGSKVIICTDGCANAGIGTLPDENASEVEITQSRLVYTEFGEFAKQHSLEGTDCRLVHLGLVAQMTGGLVDIVDPNHLDHQFGNILSNRTLATDVTVMLCLHHTLYFRGPGMAKQNSTRVEQVGDVSRDTDMVVEFGVKSVANEDENPVTIANENRQAGKQGTSETTNLNTNASTFQGVALGSTARIHQKTSLPAGETNPGTSMNIHAKQNDTPADGKLRADLPFQLQLQFTARDATKYRRVITKLRECTDKRETAEADMNIDIVGAATSKEVSNIALAGDYRVARAAVKSKKKMSSRHLGTVSSGGDDNQRDDAADYMAELNDLEDLVKQQEKVTKHKLHGRSPAQTSQPRNPTPTSPMVLDATSSNAMPDKLANKYYSRSSKSMAFYIAQKGGKKA